MRHILIVDDEETVRYTLKTLFKREGYKVTAVSSGKLALSYINEEPDEFPVVLTDYYMENMDGLQLLKTINKINPHISVLMLTAHGSEKIAVEAMKHGACDYITKPFKNDELLLKIDKAFRLLSLEKENAWLKTRYREGFKFEKFVGNSEKMHGVYDKIVKVADNDVTVLVMGESGTGKELVASAIHNTGTRKEMPFVALNCAAIPGELLENELFGHEKGAYTGAISMTMGKFELANGGTLFLDEVGDMPLSTQVKLLRTIQEKKIERVGGNETIDVDVRIIAATHKELNELIKTGEFREDLYYRLNVINIVIPSLRERTDDIPLLVNHFIQILNAKMGREIKGFTVEAMNFFKKYLWPGNVRQLQNAIERIMVLTDNTLIDYEETVRLSELSDVEAKSAVCNDNLMELDFKEAQKCVLSDFEKTYLTEALLKCHGNISKTAQAIGVHRTHLHDKIKEHGIDMEEIKQRLKND